MTPPRRHRRSRRKRQGNFAFLYRLLTFVMICGAIVAALSLFFKALTGDNREKRAMMGSRMALKRQNGVTYAGELLAGANYCGLDEESLRLGFNLVMAEWAA